MGKNVLPGHIIVLTMLVAFVGHVKSILIHMNNIGKQFLEPTICIKNSWLKGHCLPDKQKRRIKDRQGNKEQPKYNQNVY